MYSFYLIALKLKSYFKVFSFLLKDLKQSTRDKMEILDVRSNNNEKYRCTIPVVYSETADELNENTLKVINRI